MKTKKQYTADFKTKVVLEVLREEGTINEIAEQYGINPVVISRWKGEFLERAPEIFKKGPSIAEKELETEKERSAQLERKIGQLTYEVDWLKKKSDEFFHKRKRS
jgi:transposase